MVTIPSASAALQSLATARLMVAAETTRWSASPPWVRSVARNWSPASNCFPNASLQYVPPHHFRPPIDAGSNYVVAHLHFIPLSRDLREQRDEVCVDIANPVLIFGGGCGRCSGRSLWSFAAPQC